jgi:hypothetical protein
MRAIAFLKPVPCALHGKYNLPVSGKQTVEDKASCAHAGRRYHDIKICAMPIRNRARLWVRVIRPAKNGPGLALQSFSYDMRPGWTGSGAKGNLRFYALCVKTIFTRFTQRPQRTKHAETGESKAAFAGSSWLIRSLVLQPKTTFRCRQRVFARFA